MKKMKKIFLPVLLVMTVLIGGCKEEETDETVPESTAVSEASVSETAEVVEETAEADTVVDYETALFDNSYIHDINVEITEEDWEDLLANPLDKPKYNVTVTVDGEVYENVAFSPKGNASLFIVAGVKKNDRYSFKLNFHKYDKSQTYHGLRELVLNNSFNDNSYIRDYAASLAFKAAGIPTALMSFVKLSINGEYYGLYMAAETIDKEYLNRNFDGDGALYKVESAVLAARDGKVIDSVRDCLETGTEGPCELSFTDLDPDYTTKGADFRYTDDEEDSYTDIFDNNETKTTEEDRLEVITALKNLSLGNIDEALDKDEVIRYFAAHNFVCNSDSYTSVMLHNYYLYEKDGILSMIPWDYNVMGETGRPVTGGSETCTMEELINMGIDSPTFQEVKLENRPMLAWIFEDEEAHRDYQNILGEEIAAYFSSDALAEEMERMYEMIEPYVETDPTSFCTPEEFKEEYQLVVNFFQKRAESIRKQLDGSLSKVTAEQDPEDRVTLD